MSRPSFFQWKAVDRIWGSIFQSCGSALINVFPLWARRIISIAETSVALRIFGLGDNGEMLWRLSQERVSHILRLPMVAIWGSYFWCSEDWPLTGHRLIL